MTRDLALGTGGNAQGGLLGPLKDAVYLNLGRANLNPASDGWSLCSADQ